jgi:uncharacterized protein (TIGR03083 family)
MTTPATDSQLAGMIAAERGDMAALLRGLPEQSWNAPSLCAGWRVREVVAHMTMVYRYSPVRFFTELAKSRGRIAQMADRCARRDASGSPSVLVSSMAENAASVRKPAGMGYEGGLIHDVIHGLDVTVPLGLDRQVPKETLRAVLTGVTKPKPLKHFGTDLSGVELRADDLDWSFGSGTPVSGSAQDLALVICGRKLPAGRLRGEASSRFTAP